MYIAKRKRPNRLIDTIASNMGYGHNNVLFNLTYLLSYPQSRDAIASKKRSGGPKFRDFS